MLQRLLENLSPNGTLIVALPNTMHWKQRFLFLLVRFRYTEGGLLDNTHFPFLIGKVLIFYLSKTAMKSSIPLLTGISLYREFAVFLPIAISSWLEMKAAVLFPGFFGIQFVFTCSNSIKLSKTEASL